MGLQACTAMARADLGGYPLGGGRKGKKVCDPLVGAQCWSQIEGTSSSEHFLSVLRFELRSPRPQRGILTTKLH